MTRMFTKSDLVELALDTLGCATGGATRTASSIDIDPIIYDTLKGAMEGFARGGPEEAILDGGLAHFEAMFKAGLEDEQAAGRPDETYSPATMNEDGSINPATFSSQDGGDAHGGDDSAAHNDAGSSDGGGGGFDGGGGSDGGGF
jgi:hypothetical protein